MSKTLKLLLAGIAIGAFAFTILPKSAFPLQAEDGDTAWHCYEDDDNETVCVTAEFWDTFFSDYIKLNEESTEAANEKMTARIKAGTASIPNVAVVITSNTLMVWIPGINEADYPGSEVHYSGTDLAHYHLPRW